MKSTKLYLALVLFIFCGSVRTASAKENPLLPAPEVKTVKDLNASVKTVYFSFETGQIVPESESVTAKWDIAFNKTAITLNGGISGNGKVAAVIVKNTSFDKLTQAPAEGYKSDENGVKAIPTGSGNGWYNYDMGSHEITPLEGTVLVFKTTNGSYVKLEILSYYHSTADETGYYTFKYAVTDGSGKF